MGRSWLVVFALVAACGDNHVVDDLDAGPEALAPTLDTIAPQQVMAGETITVTCTRTDGTVDEPITTTVDAELVVMDEAAITRSGTTLIAKRVGTISIACKLPDLVDTTPATTEIVVGAAASVVTEIDPGSILAGESIAATCTVYDGQGNVVTSESPTLEITPVETGTTIVDLAAVLTHAGNYTGRCVLPGTTTNAAPFAVLPNLAAHIAIAKSPDLPVYALGDLIDITHVVTDRYGNELFAPTVTKSSTPLTGVGPTISTPPQTFEYNGEGTYRVDAEVADPTDGGTPVTASVTLTVNSIGPAILCSSPGDGSMIVHAPGTNRTLTGTAIDVSGVTAVRVNGVPATFDAATGAFSGPVLTRFGINFAKVEAFDAFAVPTTKYCSFLVADRYANPATTTADILSLKLGPSAIDDGNRSGGLGSFGDLLHAVVNSSGLALQLHGALLAANPLKPSSCDRQVCVFGACACVLRSAINYQSSSLDGSKTVSMQLVENGLRVTARFTNLNIRMRVNGAAAGIGFDTTGNVNIASVEVTTTLDTAIAGGSPQITVRPNSTTATVGAIDTMFNGIDGFIINIAVSLANGTVRDLVATTLRTYVQNNFNAVLDGVIGGLDIATLGTTFNVPRIAGGGTVALGFGVAFSSLSTTASRMLFGIGTRMSSATLNAYPTLGVAIPPSTVLHDPTLPAGTNTGVALHVALLDQALHALWKANYLKVTLPGTTLGLPAAVAIALDARLPPVVQLAGSGIVDLSLGAVDAVVQYPGLPADTAVTFGARAHTSVSLVGNDLVFGAIVLDEVRVSSDLFTLDATELANLEQALGQAAQEVIGQALDNALPAIPIPAFPLPASLSAYGLPAGAELGVVNPTLSTSGQHFLLRGTFGER